MPLSALPLRLQDVENHFPDDDQFGTTWYGRLYRWYNKTTKTWFAFSYRCPERWARWRKFPRVIFAMRGAGKFRWENEETDFYTSEKSISTLRWETQSIYLSRVQYWCRWHFSIQWPFMVAGHFYPKASDVPTPGQPRPDLDGKVWFFYWNHFDADLVYWMVTSAYLGRNWK